MVQLPPRYQLLGTIGEGSFGVVYQAFDLTDQEIVAIKVLHPENYHSHYVEDELIHHACLAEHPHIIRLRHVFLDAGNLLCLAMEYGDGGTLLQFMKSRGRLPEHLARYLFQQLAFAVMYCHRRHIAIRDIKLENMLLSRVPPHDPALPDHCWLLKLCDFGFSKSSEPLPVMKSRVGSPAYMAPEVLRASSRSDYNGMAADVWACGVVLFCLLYGAFPFDIQPSSSGCDQYLQQLLECMDHQDLRPCEGVAVSDDCYGLLLGLLHPVPHQRLTLPRILRCPWFLEGLPPSALEFYDNPALLEQPPVVDLEVVRKAVRRAQRRHIRRQRHAARGEGGVSGAAAVAALPLVV